MKKLVFLVFIAITTLNSCLNIAKNSTVLQPIDQLQAYVEDDTDFSFTVVDSIEYKKAKVYHVKNDLRKVA